MRNTINNHIYAREEAARGGPTCSRDVILGTCSFSGDQPPTSPGRGAAGRGLSLKVWQRLAGPTGGEARPVRVARSSLQPSLIKTCFRSCSFPAATAAGASTTDDKRNSRKANESDKDKKSLDSRADSIGSGRAIPIKQVQGTLFHTLNTLNRYRGRCFHTLNTLHRYRGRCFTL
ncbi:hypothetical protein WMY93_032557 [Mugilogobius chulae]|uniref:Uncharacterized protein n=1 Tax=Mugilogobius chulae TaxID=88201 RepID=A0AAW0MMV6_9GOBI